MAEQKIVLEIAGREVSVSNPDKIYFPEAGHTKLDLIRYYLAVADGAVRGIAGRPMILKRFPHGAGTEPFYQKRAPAKRPPWVEIATFSFPSGRTADEVVVRDAAQLVWVVNLGCLDLNPHPVRAPDLDHPDELRIDLDPVPGVTWKQVQEVTAIARAVLDDFKLVGWPKTSGSRGMHICVRIMPQWTFDEVRLAALALAREVEQRAPTIATSKWWKEERQGVFVDYNQNAKDRTVAAAYSVRPTPDARVSAPLSWDEVDDCEPADFTLASMPARFEKRGDLHAGIDEHAGSIAGLLELFERQGLGDAPWPPHYRKQSSEPARVQPSKRKSKLPLIEIGRARRKQDAVAGVERWKARHPEAAAHLQPADVLVDAMRGRYTTWTRTRINLQHVPEALRPAQEPLDPDEKIRSSS